jgi:hypothetical protein
VKEVSNLSKLESDKKQPIAKRILNYEMKKELKEGGLPSKWTTKYLPFGNSTINLSCC